MFKDKEFTVADYLLTRLKQIGLDKVFQVPGDYVTHFMESLEVFDGVDAVGDVTELGAGYSADGYARFKGIGAVSVQYGVGTFSVLNAIAGSYVERNPVVVITASPSAKDREIIDKTGALFHHSTGDLNADRNVFKEVTVAAEILSCSADAPKQIDRALTKAISLKRPVYIEAWENVWGEACTAPSRRLEEVRLVSDQASLKQYVDGVWDRLNDAKQPVMILGIDVARFGLTGKVSELLNVSGLPYTTTSLAKSVVSEDIGNFIGTYAGAASLEETCRYVEESDAILSLGAIFTDDYLTILNEKYDEMMAANEDGARLGNAEFTCVFLWDVVDELIARYQDSPSNKREPTELPSLNSYNTPIQNMSEALGYESFFELFNQFMVKERLHESTNLILGESSSLYMAIRMNGFKKDGFISDAAWGSLGHETGCATGVGLADARRPIVIAGDGGFMMMCQALSTIRRNELNAVVFVMSNSVYAIEQSFVDICAFSPKGSFAPFDELPTWNYEGLAKAYGVGFCKASNGDELNTCLNAIQIDSESPFLVEVAIPEKDLAPAIQSLADSINEKPFSDCTCDN